ncbi:hypothetical protein M3Y98_00585200 [Aphelenchoides besseyi]|nr:hypothetical protein M3Y98_00585200 [Aphelenchoides besseyi]
MDAPVKSQNQSPPNYMGLFGVLSFLLIFAIVGIILWVLEKRKRQRFIQKAMLFHNLPVEMAETLYTLRKDHKIAATSEVNTRGQSRVINKPRVKSIQSDDFFHILRWIKRLKTAKEEGQLQVVVPQIIKQMEMRAHSYGLDLVEQKRLWDLAHLPEEILTQYDREQP